MTGARFAIVDLKSNKQFDVEAIGNPRTNFGDSLDNKCNGAIREKDSIINENSHKDIQFVKNPMDYINKKLKQLY